MRRSRKENTPSTSAPDPQAGPVSREAVKPQDLHLKPGGARLGEMLVEANLATEEQVVVALEAAMRGSGTSLGSQLIANGSISERDLARTLARQQSLEVVDLRQIIPDPAATALLTGAMARLLNAIPLTAHQDAVVVAVADPSPTIVQSLREVLGRPATIKIATQSDITMAIGNSYRALASIDTQVEAFQARDTKQKEKEEESRPALAEVNESAPVVQVVRLLITQGLRDRASDIHIEPQDDRIRVRYRVDGALHDVLDLPGSMGPAIVSRVKILADMNIVERRRPQDGQISMDIEGHAVDIRIATTSVVGGEKVVMRLLDKSRPIFQLAQLGMTPDVAERYSTLLHSPYGMVICSGPTGSGKTTTLYGSLSEINTPERNIMTIEDPVEYTISSINQIQINTGAGVTFAGGLKSILRQDPDVILVGEIRDVDTARIAVQSAMTGHFVLSSLHATDTVSALHRLLDMGIESFLVASSITAVISQRLLRRVCDNCRESYDPPPQEMAFFHSMGGDMPEGGFVRGAGCNFCTRTGYLERIGVYEMLQVTDTIRELILTSASHEDVRKLARSEGMRTLQEESMHLVESGVTNLTEVLRTIYVVGT
jgi:type IV pilus assembly protein PilB